ncbi:hypothetical protein [Acidithiobacillus sulfurivorans]|uniref:hypothetical protein n=1 Tax=Acidithiobacillus sulfurivorans TaxID=1958756 RepID=UPI001D01F33F|nr:hypothetical protein [Acidithiobacillus sulfurivorans]
MNRRNIRNPEQTRSDLLDPAYHEILKYGFQTASLERTLAKASVSKKGRFIIMLVPSTISASQSLQK